ncbi:hypothetical protein V7R84_12650 [Arachnia propionica]|uniref:hypothetical protein n=1 Tax=Arachnia propionica TaxID=1750 RepID=UPI0030CEE94B
MTSSRPPVRGTGPVFISYHQGSGTVDAEFIETYLRVGGIVPWRDIRDLETGTVERNVTQAFGEGLSGGILLLSSGISKSCFVPETEVPLLVEVQKKDPEGFQLHIINTFRKPGSPDECDIDAPSKQLGAKYPEAEQLRDHLQWRLLRSDDEGGTTVSELNQVLGSLLRNRLKVRRPELGDGEIEIGLQTRPEPNHLPADSRTVPEADLHIRLRQDSATQIPEELDYRCLQQALPVLIDALDAARIRRLLFRGGCHPSLAWALGSALPHAREIERFTWRDTYGKEWTSTDEPAECSTSICLETLNPDGTRCPLGFAPDEMPSSAELQRALWGNAPAKNLVVLLAADDLRPSPLLALAKKLDDAPVLVINLHTPSADGVKKWMDHTEGNELARRVGGILRSLADLATTLHLAVSAPVAMAALTARWCNTLTIDFYELGNTGMGVREYIRVLRTESGNSSPITGVFPQGMPQVDEVKKLVNLTPHDVTYYPEAGEPFTWAAPEGSDQWVRRQEQSEELPSLRVQGREIPVTRIRQGDIAPKPDPVSGVGYIVPRISAEMARRPDFFFPHGEVRGQGGSIIGCRRLGCFEAVSNKVLPYLEFLDPIPQD